MLKLEEFPRLIQYEPEREKVDSWTQIFWSWPKHYCSVTPQGFKLGRGGEWWQFSAHTAMFRQSGFPFVFLWGLGGKSEKNLHIVSGCHFSDSHLWQSHEHDPWQCPRHIMPVCDLWRSELLPSNLLTCAGHRQQEICLSVNTIQGSLFVVAARSRKGHCSQGPKGEKKDDAWCKVEY